MRYTFLLAIPMLALAPIHQGCQGVAYAPTTAEGQRNAFLNAQATWKAGISTFQDMKDEYGEPTDTAKTKNGFAARWVRTSRVFSQAETGSSTVITNRTFRNETARPTFTSTIKSALEAFYDEQNVLTSFRIQFMD